MEPWGWAGVPTSPKQSGEELEVGHGRRVAFCVFSILFNPYTLGGGDTLVPIL